MSKSKAASKRMGKAHSQQRVVRANPVVNCTHPVPKNRFGIFAMHCKDNQPMSKKDLRAIINGPIAAMQDKLTEELAKPVIPAMICPNDKVRHGE